MSNNHKSIIFQVNRNLSEHGLNNWCLKEKDSAFFSLFFNDSFISDFYVFEDNNFVDPVQLFFEISIFINGCINFHNAKLNS